MQSYLLVLEVEPMDVDNNYPMLPLHCTLVHWFWADAKLRDSTHHLDKIAQTFLPQQLEIGEEATYTGQTKQGPIPVTVNKVELTFSLKQLHTEICDLLDSIGVKYSAPQYTREGFSPHVTHQAGAKLDVSTLHTSKAIYLVEADAPEYGNPRHILAKFELHH